MDHTPECETGRRGLDLYRPAHSTGKDCIFCQPHENDVMSTGKVRLRRDAYPVSPGHWLIIPLRHVLSWFDLSTHEILDIHTLARSARDYTPADAWTIGVNDGPAAGQTVSHMHLHLIPRFEGDVPDPRGGIRGVIPSKKVPE